MSEQEHLDRLLRESMAAPAPRLSSGFDQKLQRRLHTRQLGAGARWTLILYALLSLAASVWLMRHEAIDWTLVAVAVLAPLAAAAVVFARRLSS